MTERRSDDGDESRDMDSTGECQHGDIAGQCPTCWRPHSRPFTDRRPPPKWARELFEHLRDQNQGRTTNP